MLDFLKNEPVKIVLYGSRARGDNYPASDVDIGLIPLNDFDEIKVTLLRDALKNSNIPYKVEIVNLLEVSDEFRQEALKDAVVWKN